MDLIIDGYNLMGADQGLGAGLESKRNWLMQRVGAYQRRKGFNVLVVFDGWRSGQVQETRQMREGVMVIFSRLGEKADDVIVRLARERGSGCVVVTSDREIHKALDRLGAVAVYSSEFQQILRRLDEAFEPDESDEEERARHGNPNRLAKIDRKRQEDSKNCGCDLLGFSLIFRRRETSGFVGPILSSMGCCRLGEVTFSAEGQ